MGWGEPLAPVFNAANAVEIIGRNDLIRRLRRHASIAAASSRMSFESECSSAWARSRRARSRRPIVWTALSASK